MRIDEMMVLLESIKDKHGNLNVCFLNAPGSELEYNYIDKIGVFPAYLTSDKACGLFMDHQARANTMSPLRRGIVYFPPIPLSYDYTKDPK